MTTSLQKREKALRTVQPQTESNELQVSNIGIGFMAFQIVAFAIWSGVATYAITSDAEAYIVAVQVGIASLLFMLALYQVIRVAVSMSQ